MAAIARKGVPFPELLAIAGKRVAPVGFVIGASIEAFMVQTGFYKVATRKAAERQHEVKAARRELTAGGGAGRPV